MTMDHSGDDSRPSPAGKPAEANHPRNWWQWFLVYPSIAMAMISAVPTLYQAYVSHKANVPFQMAFDAEEQARLWMVNEECTRNAQYTTILTPHQVEVGSLICKSGDVLLRAKRPEWDNPQLRWVAWSSIAASKDPARTNTGLLGLISSAQAQEFSIVHPSQNAPRVICQRWVGNGLLLQRVSMQNGCFDQVVNTFNGWVVSSHPAPCAPSC
ncbi:MAG: hypothetical protein ACXWG8_05030 [Usitatibacter sp.]